MINIFNNDRWVQSCNYFKAAWNGESPTCRLNAAARQVLDPSCYRYSYMGRAALALRGLTMSLRYVDKVSDFITNLLKNRGFETELATAPLYKDEEFATFADVQAVQQEFQKVHNGIKQDKKRKKGFKFVEVTQTASGPLPQHETKTLFYNGRPIAVTTAWAQGKRSSMEDEHLAESFQVQNGSKSLDACVFGVFDGHSGNRAAKFLKANLVKVLKLYLAREPRLTNTAIANALTLACLDLDNRFAGTSGACASITLLIKDKIWVSNVGDSRTVLDNNGHTRELSRDAKPEHQPFRAEIEARGGIVERPANMLDDWRINRRLNVARTIGDHCVIGQEGFGCRLPRPELYGVPLSKIDPNARIITACDGLWDVATSREVVQAKKGAPELVRGALAAGSQDNVSVITIDLSKIGRPVDA